MKLTMEQIQSIALGTTRLSEEKGSVCFHRFTQEQEAGYQLRSEEFWKKTYASAGVKLSFRTDSPWLRLKGEAVQTMPRTYFSIDVAVDHMLVGTVDNFSHMRLPQDYTTMVCKMGEFDCCFDLGPDKKHVVIHFPWTAKVLLEVLELEEGAVVEPVRPEKTLLVFGDSITQGYDALRPSNRYAARLADALGAEEFNKAIGGEVFWPELAMEKDALEPDYITVAYGTNDWSKTERKEMLEQAEAFLKALKRNYPCASIYVLLPIWRKDRDEYRPYGSFDQMRQDLRQTAEGLSLSVLDCYDFVPKNPAYFADLRLHPNDEGFIRYADCLAREIGRKG